MNEAEITQTTALLTRPVVVGGGIAYAVGMRLIFALILLCIVDVIADTRLRYSAVLSAHALSTIVGAISFLPGAVVIGSFAELINARGVPRVYGLLVALTKRILSSAFNLGLGVLVLVARYRSLLNPSRAPVTMPSPTLGD